MQKTKIGTFEAIMLIFTIVITHTISALPRIILSYQQSASILNLLYVGIIAIILSYFIYKLLKKFPGFDIIDISELAFGKIFKNIIGIIFIAYFIISSSMLLRNFCESLKILYYPMTNIIFIIGFFIISNSLANRLEFNATLKTNLIVFPIILFSMIFLFIANIDKFIPERIFPILGGGFYNTFVLGLTNLASFSGIAFIYFLPPFLKEPDKLKQISLISVGLTAIYLILSVATLLFMFSFFQNTNEIAPLYNVARYIEFGSFFERLDSLFLLIWILSFACYFSIVTKFAMHIFKKLTNIETKKPLIDIFGLLVFAISMYPKNSNTLQIFENKVFPTLAIGIIFILGITILIFAYLQKNRKEYNNNG